VLLIAALAAAGVAYASALAPRGPGERSPSTCRGEEATIAGTADDDRLVGTPRRDVIVAGAGDDTVVARGGADLICDGDGDDRVRGGAGSDEVGGGRGEDRLNGGPGDDWLAGRRGADVMAGGRGDDRLVGERGDDVLRGDAGDDRLGGGPGDDECVGGGGVDVAVECEEGTPSDPRDPGGPGGPSGDPAAPGSPGAPGGPTPPSDQPPSAADDTATVTEDAAAEDIPVLINDSDSDGGPKSIASATQPANGNVQVTGGGTGLTYEPDPDYCNDPPGTATDDFTYTLAPGGSSGSVAVTVSCVNDASSVMTSLGTLAYTEGGAGTAVDPLVLLVDGDDSQLEGATVRISAGWESADELVFVNQLGITGVYNTGTGALTLTGTATVAQYQTALRSIQYRHAGDNPAVTKTVEFRADDGEGLGPASTRNIDVTRVNDAPSVDTSAGSASFTEGGGPVAVDPNVTLADPDSATLSGGTVAITGGFAAADDSLGFTGQNGIMGSYDVGTGVLTLSGDASLADYQAALRSVTYDNDSDAPSGARTVSFRVSDGALDSNADTRDVTVTGTNDAPVVTASAGTTPYTEGDPATAVDGGLTVADPDDTNLEGATVRIATGFQAGDELVYLDQNGVTGSVAGDTLTLTGTATVADYQTALRSVRFRHLGDNPVASKTVEFTVNDGDADSAPATKSIALTRVNDAPAITATAANLAYTENAGPVAIDSGLSVTDPDSAELSGATVTVTGNHEQAQDDLGFTDQNGITSTYNDATGVLTLSGTASVAEYQTALRSVTYTNISEGPTPATRTISFQATDAPTPGLASNTATRGIAITSVNDPPAAVNDSGATDEDTTLTTVAPGVLANDTDLDPGDTKTVDRLNNSATLTGTSAKGAAVTIDANGSYTYSPGSIFQGLSTGQSDTDSFTYRMSDGAGSSSTATVNLTITGVSDAPVAGPDSFDAIGNTALSVGTSRPAGEAGKVITGSVLTNDTDVDTPQTSLTTVAETKATILGGTITFEADGTFTYHPDDGDVGVTDTVQYTVTDGVANSTGTLSLPLAGQVWYVQNNEPAGGDGTSDTPFDTLAEAETASGSGDTVYVFDGSNTATNLDTGFVMEANERLIGEHNGVSLAGHLLHAGTANAHPTLNASDEDVVAMASGATVDGFNIDPSGSGGGISGASGAVTINDVNVADGGTAGTQPGVDLDGTSGTTNLSDLTVSTNGATGVRLNNAGTVNFTSASTITIASNAARGLDATGPTTNLGASTFDSITVTGSGNGGVSMSGTTGTTTFGDLSLATTGGTAFLLSSAGDVTVLDGGTANVNANGGPAINVTGTAGASLRFDQVSSASSTTDGINLAGLGSGTFSATGGSISGAAGYAIDLDGGSGNVTYPGGIADGSGGTADITGRTGGTVTVSGAITDGADAAGGISLSGNTGGATTFGNAAKTLNTGIGTAVSFTTSDGHTLNLTGGGLDIDTTSGQGIVATSSGTINVAGTGNTVASTTGRAVNVQSTDFGGSGFTLQSVSSNGAANGILLNATGTTSGMTITGTGAANSGGTIQNATEHGVSLTSTTGFNADELSITGANFAGVDGTDVTNFTYTDGEVIGAGDSLTNDAHAAFAFNDVGSNNVDGQLTVTGNTVTNPYGGGVQVRNASGTLSQATVSSNAFQSTTNPATSKQDGVSFHIEGTTTTAAALSQAAISSNSIVNFPSGNGVELVGEQITSTVAPRTTFGSPDTANRVEVTNNEIRGDATNKMGVFGVAASVTGMADGNVRIANNGTAVSPVRNMLGEGIAVGASGTANADFIVEDNFVSPGNVLGNVGISANANSRTVGGTIVRTPDVNATIADNTVSNSSGSGIKVVHFNSNGTLRTKITNNTVGASTQPNPGIGIENGSTSGVAGIDPTLCAQISGNATTASAADGFGNVFPGVDLIERSVNNTTYKLQIHGLTPATATPAQTESFLATQNPASSLGGGFYAGRRASVSEGNQFEACTITF
jgi:hypothetical protein